MDLCLDYDIEAFDLSSINTDRLQEGVPILVDEGVYFGPISTSFSLERLNELHITHVINACSTEFLYEDNFVTLHVHLKDDVSSDLLSILMYTTAFIQCGAQEGGVLVYCRGGKSRSVSIVAAYLMCVRQFSYVDVLSYLKSKRSVINANEGFKKQLKQLYDVIRAVNSPTYSPSCFNEIKQSRAVNIDIINPLYGRALLSPDHSSSESTCYWVHSSQTDSFGKSVCDLCISQCGVSLCTLFKTTLSPLFAIKSMSSSIIKTKQEKRRSIFTVEDEDEEDELIIPVSLYCLSRTDSVSSPLPRYLLNQQPLQWYEEELHQRSSLSDEISLNDIALTEIVEL